jgi:hypothetical protein
MIKYWQDEITLYEKEFQDYESRCKRIESRYRDERKMQPNGVDTIGDSRFNILWANIETIFPAVYNKLPKPDVSRRYKDKDPTGRVASLMLERCLEYEIEQYSDFDASIKNTLYDRLLAGRGTSWIRYEPTFVDGEPVTGQVSEDVEQYNDKEGEYEQVLAKECAPVDYVNWADFGHSSAKTWEEVKGVWRRVLMDKEALETRFGDVAEERGYTIDSIPIDQAQFNLDSLTEARRAEHKKAAVYEVWDKSKKKVLWLCKGMDIALDERDDPLKLDEFFPCPKPMYATTTTNSLVPVPDYVQYQDQARELDQVTNRISLLVEAVKVVGVYDASQESIKRLLSEGSNNTLIPVDNWAMFGEKGGLKGTVDFLPLDMVVNALNNLYLAREQTKNIIYEITGIADILRGQSDPNETLGAQQIKSNYAGLRIRYLQMDVARFARDLIRLKSEIICEFFSDETIIQMSGAQQFTEQDQPYIGQALELLRDDVLRNFRIDIESDSMVEADEQQEKAQAVELLTGTADFMQKVVPAIQEAPEIAPLLMEVFMHSLRRFTTSKTIEGVYQETFDKIQEQMKQPKPDPAAAENAQAQAEMQMKQQEAQANMQVEQMKVQAQAQDSQAKAQLEQAKIASQQQLEQERLGMEQWKVRFTEANKLRLAGMARKQANETSESDEVETELEAADMETGIVQELMNSQQQLAQQQAETSQLLMQALGQLIQLIQTPKVRTLVRDANGTPISSVETIQ